MESIELELAIELIKKSVNEITDVEIVDIEHAKDRVILEDIYSPINQPPFNRSPLDGYALKSTDTQGASKETPRLLKVVNEVFAGGSIDTVVKENEAVRIMTGAEIPEGADCVIRQEDTDYGMEIVKIYSQLKSYQNYCFAGEDVKKSTKVISKGEKLTYIHIGLLAMMGITKVKVRRKPMVAIISTGDEVISGGQPLPKRKIYDSNRIIISSRISEFGCDVVYSDIVGDDANKVSEKIDSVIDKVDFVITTGGVSVGKKDIMHEVIKKLCAERVFWKIKMKPGSPALYSMYKNKPILSLSGNPFAALVTFQIMGKALIYKLTNDTDLKEERKKVIMEDNFMKESKGRRMIRAIYKDNKVYMPNGEHSSGMLASMLGCNCFVDIKPGTKKVLKGEEVEIILL